MAKRPISPLQSDRVRLRLLEAADLPLTLAWRNQDHIRRWFFSSALITPEQHQAWFEAYRQRDDDFLFIIEQMQGEPLAPRPVGQAALYHVDWVRGQAEFGRLLIGERDAAGRGLGRAATDLLVQFGLERLGLQEIYLEVFADNAAARAVYAACGFTVSGQEGNVVVMTKRRAP